jgi:hypothetical protein
MGHGSHRLRGLWVIRRRGGGCEGKEDEKEEV